MHFGMFTDSFSPGNNLEIPKWLSINGNGIGKLLGRFLSLVMIWNEISSYCLFINAEIAAMRKWQGKCFSENRMVGVMTAKLSSK